MIIAGQAGILQNLVRGIRSVVVQAQPCGIDLTLKRMLVWKSSGVVDFDNSSRRSAETAALPFQTGGTVERASDLGFVDLPIGSYLVEFNETVDMPLDVMGQIYVRSSLFRSGALLNAGVMDCGYKGTVGALLQVVNPHGIRLWKDARLAQLVFHQMSEATEGYKGIYQGQETM
jgi:dUTP pyrophosphatase